MKAYILLLFAALGVPRAAAEPPTVADLVRHELAMLPFYSVFDDLNCRVEGDTVELTGYVSRDSLRADAEEAVARLDCVKRVVNRIAVLPVSASDDRIRLAAFRAFATNLELGFFVNTPVPSFHIVVLEGVVTLEGSVASSRQVESAAELLLSVEGVKQIRNRLRVDSARAGEVLNAQNY